MQLEADARQEEESKPVVNRRVARARARAREQERDGFARAQRIYELLKNGNEEADGEDDW